MFKINLSTHLIILFTAYLSACMLQTGGYVSKPRIYHPSPKTFHTRSYWFACTMCGTRYEVGQEPKRGSTEVEQFGPHQRARTLDLLGAEGAAQGEGHPIERAQHVRLLLAHHRLELLPPAHVVRLRSCTTTHMQTHKIGGHLQRRSQDESWYVSSDVPTRDWRTRCINPSNTVNKYWIQTGTWISPTGREAVSEPHATQHQLRLSLHIHIHTHVQTIRTRSRMDESAIHGCAHATDMSDKNLAMQINILQLAFGS